MEQSEPHVMGVPNSLEQEQLFVGMHLWATMLRRPRQQQRESHGLKSQQEATGLRHQTLFHALLAILVNGRHPPLVQVENIRNRDGVNAIKYLSVAK
jgi:hypothetical protein